MKKTKQCDSRIYITLLYVVAKHVYICIKELSTYVVALVDLFTAKNVAKYNCTDLNHLETNTVFG